jgi:hypothetical protein
MNKIIVAVLALQILGGAWLAQNMPQLCERASQHVALRLAAVEK